MNTVNNVLKWSFFLSGFTGLMFLGIIFSTWLLIEMLAVLAGITV